ncbi:MAG: tetratricopeptide repeat protein, partial [Catalinimonas sp.]
ARVIDYGTAALDGRRPNDADEIAMLVAESYYRRGDYAAAAPRFNQFAEQNRSLDADVRYKVGWSNFMVDDWERAVEHFKVLASRDDSLGQNAAYHLGVAYLQLSNRPYALTALDRARQQNYDPQVRERALLNYAKLTLEQRRNAEAVDALKTFIADYPNSALRRDADDLLGEAYLNTDDYEAAINHIERIPRLTSGLRRTYQQVTFYQGTRLFNDKRFREALDYFEKSLKYPEDDELQVAAHFWSGETWSLGRKWDEAIASYAAVFALPQSPSTPYHLRARYGIGYAYFNTQQYGRALPHFRTYTEALADAPDQQNYADALVRLADCQYVTKDYDGALRTYDAAIARRVPDRDYCHYQKSVVLGLLGRPEEARQQLRIVMEEFPRSRFRDEALIQRAQLAFEAGDYEGAARSYTALLEAQPNSKLAPYAYLRRGIALSNLQRPDPAIRDYQKILDDYPNHATADDALLGLQESLAAAGRMGEFDRYLARYKQANPESNALESVEFEAAKTLYFDEKYAEAIARFRDYVGRYAGSAFVPDANYYLGEAYYRNQQPSEALRAHRRVIDEGRGTFVDRSVDRAAGLEYDARNYRAAIGLYRRLLVTARSRRQEFTAWSGLMQTYFALDQYDSTRYFAQQIVAAGNAGLDAQHQALLLSGKVALAQDRPDDAVDFFLSTLNTAKDAYGAEAQYLMAKVFYDQGNHEQSLETLYDLNQSFSQYTDWLDRSFLLIADNFAAQGELFQARATLRSIAEKSPNAKTRAEAQAKLTELDQRKQEAPAEDTTFAN